MDSEQEVSDDNEDEWTYPESGRNAKGTPKKVKKEGLSSTNAHKSGRGPGRPPKQHKDRAGQHHQPAQQHGADTAGGVADFHSLKVRVSAADGVLLNFFLH